MTRKPALGRSGIALIGAFVLAFVHQYLFYGNLPGVSYPLFVFLLYVYLFYDWKDRLQEITGFGWFLFVVILLLSLTYALFNNPVFYALNLVAVPPLIFIHVAFIRGVKKIAWWDIRIVGEALNHLIPQSLRHVPTAFRIMKVSISRRVGDRQKSIMGKVLIGLAISLPLLIIVIYLLASADGVFNRVLSGLPEWWNSLSLGESIARGIWIVVFGVLFFGYFWGFVKQSSPHKKKAASATSEEAATKFCKEEYPEMKPLLENRWATLANEKRNWPSFNGSRFRAEKELSRLFDY